jgi:hypothetical protein
MAELVARALVLLPARQRRRLLGVRPTIDLDPTEVEVHGAAKQGVAWNHLGQRAKLETKCACSRWTTLRPRPKSEGCWVHLAKDQVP